MGSKLLPWFFGKRQLRVLVMIHGRYASVKGNSLLFVGAQAAVRSSLAASNSCTSNPRCKHLFSFDLYFLKPKKLSARSGIYSRP